MKGFFDIQPKIILARDNCEVCGLYKTVESPKIGITGNGRKKILIWGIMDEDSTISEQLLKNKLRKLRIRMDLDCWKINSVGCISNNKKPSSKELSLCLPRIQKIIKELKPEKIILIGITAINSFLGDRMNNIGSLVKWIGWTIPDQDYKCWVFPIYHPQYINNNSDNDKKNIMKKQPNKALDLIFDEHLETAIKWDAPCYNYDSLKKNIHIIQTPKEAIEVLEDILQMEYRIVIDFEATGLKPHAKGHKILCISISYRHPKEGLISKVFPNFNDRLFHRKLKQVFTSMKIKKVAQNMKFENSWSKFILGYTIKPWVWDTMQATHVLDNRNGITSLDFQSYVNYGILNIHTDMKQYIESKEKSSNSFNRLEDMDINKLMDCCGLHTLLEYKLMEKQQLEIKEEAIGYRLLHDGILALSDIENTGINIDVTYYERQKIKLKRTTTRLENNLKNSKEAILWKSKNNGGEINFNSPDQLSKLLFNYLGFTPIKETASGKYSTDEKTLRQLEGQTTIVDSILQKKKLKKIEDKIDGFLRETIDGVMRPNFDLHIARTFRSVSNSPNFQNIHKRDKQAQEMLRKGIIPSPGNMLVSRDFKGIEVAISCAYHRDPEMIKYVKNPEMDMHRDLAMQLFMLKKNQMTSDIRYSGKNEFIFPQFYGDWYESCARELWKSANIKNIAGGDLLVDHLHDKGIKNYRQFEKHVKNVEYDFWYKRFKRYTEWKNEIWEEYQANGYITLLSGFKCSDLMDKKQVINSPIQGTAFHILLWSLIELNKVIKELGLKSKLIGQIHDDILSDEYPGEFDKIQKEVNIIIKEKIRKHWSWINVPLEIETAVSEVDGNWYAMKEI